MWNDEECGEPRPDKAVETTVRIRIEWSEADVISRVIEKVASTIHDSIKEQVAQAILDCLNDKVNEAVQEVMEREVQQTDRWGKPMGKLQSIRALLQRDAEAWLTEMVDRDGRSGRDSYGKEKARISWLFRKALDKDLPAKVKAAIKENIGDVERMITDEVRDKVAQLLKSRR